MSWVGPRRLRGLRRVGGALPCLLQALDHLLRHRVRQRLVRRAEHREAGLVDDLPALHVLERVAVADVAEVLQEVEEEDEIFVCARIADAKELGRFSGARRAGEEHRHGAVGEWEIQLAEDSPDRGVRSVSAPRRIRGGLLGIEAPPDLLPLRAPRHGRRLPHGFRRS